MTIFRKQYKYLFVVLGIVISPLLLAHCIFGADSSNAHLDYKRLQAKAKEAAVYCKQNKLETKYCFLIDMSLHSGVERFFIWDFAVDTIVAKAMVSHGCGSQPWGQDFTKDNPTFSNIPDSHESSLGKYKIGARGYSQWGINVNYKMYGLEHSNSKAYERYIVLHSWNMVPNSPVYPSGTPEGWGCPAVSNEFMLLLDQRMKNKSKDVLLWILDPK